MSEFLSIGGQDSVARAGDAIASAAESFEEKAKDLVGRIRDVAATQPWGEDSFGHEFHTAYTQLPEGSPKPFNQLIEDELEQSGQDLLHIGRTAVSAMGTYEATDVLGGGTIARSAELA